ncbi:MAG: hypothetical protein HXS54_16250 [Theionarchaea archaeon]|nr:hypothetical protein [Theionarchaea archaeon]
MWNDLSIWQVLPVVAAFVTIIVTICLYILGQKKKELGYEILENLSLVSVEEDVKDRIELYFDKKKVSDVSLILFRVINTGNIPITKNDFEKPIVVSFGDNARILEISTEKTEPQNLEVEFKLKESSMEIDPALFNPKDYVIFKVLAGQCEGVNMITRIVGVKEIKDITYRRELYRDFVEGLMLGRLSGAEMALELMKITLGRRKK